MYVGDTVVFADSRRQVHNILRTIEEAAEAHGLRPNRGKCEVLQCGPIRAIKFREGREVQIEGK